MNVIVIGYGSIGKRHVDNLLKLKQIDQIVVCSKHHDSFQNHPKKENLKVVHALEDLPHMMSDGSQFDFAVIANETYKHTESVRFLTEFCINFFIEKPVSHSIRDAMSLIEIVEKINAKMFIAYNLRFLRAIQYIKNKINSGVIGTLYFAEIEVGQYLPTWRPQSDYRESYSARKELGGGVALDLSHEIDYMRYLFGDPVSWRVMKSKVSDLEISAEDLFKGIYRFTGGFICSVHMDYIRQNKKRAINIVGSKASLECDFIKKQIKIQNNSGEISIIEDINLFDVDESYRSELNHFIGCIENNNTPQITLNDGIEVMRLIEEDHV